MTWSIFVLKNFPCPCTSMDYLVISDFWFITFYSWAGFLQLPRGKEHKRTSRSCKVPQKYWLSKEVNLPWLPVCIKLYDHFQTCFWDTQKLMKHRCSGERVLSAVLHPGHQMSSNFTVKGLWIFCCWRSLESSFHGFANLSFNNYCSDTSLQQSLFKLPSMRFFTIAGQACIPKPKHYM